MNREQLEKANNIKASIDAIKSATKIAKDNLATMRKIDFLEIGMSNGASILKLEAEEIRVVVKAFLKIANRKLERLENEFEKL